MKKPRLVAAMLSFTLATGAGAVPVEFFVSVDDYAKLYINGQLVASYDAFPWGSAQATVDLAEGWHDIRLEYKNRFGSTALRLMYKYPNESDFKIIPRHALRSTDRIGAIVPGLRAEYSNGQVVYGEGPIEHGWPSLYQGQTSALWGGFDSNWGIFSENLAGQVRISAGLTLGERAAQLAQGVIGSSYLWGAKGWDTQGANYVEPADISSGYHYSWQSPATLGSGVDCSGLVLWSYNKGFGATRYLNNANPIWYEGADGQYNYNSTAVANASKQPGDLMFFDTDGDGDIDHVTMYAGGDAVANAKGQAFGIVLSSAATLEAATSFRGYRRPNNPQVDFQVRAYSPVTLSVTDPEGFAIDQNTLVVTPFERRREVPRQLYYSVADMNGDGKLDELVYSPIAKSGKYVVRPQAKPAAAPHETFSIETIIRGTSLFLATDVRVQDLPQEGYGILVDGTSVAAFVPARVAVKTEATGSAPINPRSAGRTPIAIYGSKTFDVQTIDPSSLRAGRAEAVALAVSHPHDIDGDGYVDLLAHFPTTALGVACSDRTLPVRGSAAQAVGVRLVLGDAPIRAVGCK